MLSSTQAEASRVPRPSRRPIIGYLRFVVSYWSGPITLSAWQQTGGVAEIIGATHGTRFCHVANASNWHLDCFACNGRTPSALMRHPRLGITKAGTIYSSC
jgi:hypothetical protein